MTHWQRPGAGSRDSLFSAACGLDFDANSIDRGAHRAGQGIPDSRNFKAQACTKNRRINPHRELLLTQGGRCDVVRERFGQCRADIFLERNRGFRTARQVLQPRVADTEASNEAGAAALAA